MAAIEKIAVLGSGVMGSGIAAQAANAGVPVVLLDIVPQGAQNRNALAEKAVERQLTATPPGFAHKGRAKLVTCGNLEDHLDLLRDCDWIVEAVLEKLEVKHSVYRTIDAVRKPGSVVSSNTSTLPLHALLQGMPASLKPDFMITHFFNPPRFMRLLELVQGPDTRRDAFEAVERFADLRLGKGVVRCKDTPGFIANRIGVYWLMLGLIEAMRMGVTVEQADAVMGRPAGIPKTGIFGLFDLIGIDLMPLIATSMLAALPRDDAFCALYQEPELIRAMIADGYTGRKGKGGFYRMNQHNGKKVKEALNLSTGEYAPEARKVGMASVEAAKTGLRALLEHGDIGGKYAWAVLSGTICYAASLLPEISDDIESIDETMRLGYNWRYGPFELIDRMGNKEQSGAAWFAQRLAAEGRNVPPVVEKAAGRLFYAADASGKQAMSLAGQYRSIAPRPGMLVLSDLKRSMKPVLKNASASLWDMGDGIACFEITSKMNAVDPDILALMQQSLETVRAGFAGMVIGGDGENFSVGANLGFVLMAANIAAWDQIAGIIRDGQNTMMAMKYAPFPIVCALAGMALGGGCEIVLHSGGVQAHIEAYPGLVETGVGLIPGWGGCKEMLARHIDPANPGSVSAGIQKAFETIAFAKVAGSAEEARDMKIVRPADRITMNRARVLSDAKARCLEMAQGYTPPASQTLRLPGATARTALYMAIDQFAVQGKVTPHDAVIGRVLAHVLSGGDTDMTDELTEEKILELELAGFMELVKTKSTLARIEHMLETGKPLRN